jgi:hypothetical protein
MKFTVTMAETTYQDVEVEADSEEEAKQKAHVATHEDGFCWDGDMEVTVHDIEQVAP